MAEPEECCSRFTRLQNRNMPGVNNAGMGSGRQRRDGFLRGTSPKSGEVPFFTDKAGVNNISFCDKNIHCVSH